MKFFLFLLKIIPSLLLFQLFAEEIASDEKSSWHQYDPKSRVEKWTLTNEKEIEWVYDISGNRIKWTDWTGTTRFSYDICNHLEEVTSPDGQKTSYKHDL
jgi:YD repeat-containing protein